MIFQEIKKLLTPNSLCLEYKCILMKTFIWKFPFYHGLERPKKKLVKTFHLTVFNNMQMRKDPHLYTWKWNGGWELLRSTSLFLKD